MFSKGLREILADVTALCPVIATWNGYDVDSTLRIEGTELHYSCYKLYASYGAIAYGKATDTVRYHFIDGSSTESKVAYCRAGQWIPPIVDCIGSIPASMRLIVPVASIRIISVLFSDVLLVTTMMTMRMHKEMCRLLTSNDQNLRYCSSARLTPLHIVAYTA